MMSWSFSVPSSPVGEFEQATNAALEQYLRLQTGEFEGLSEEAEQQIATAMGVAMSIVGNGVVGSGTVAAMLSGHANPGHTPKAGWANDVVTVQVYCTDPVPKPE